MHASSVTGGLLSRLLESSNVEQRFPPRRVCLHRCFHCDMTYNFERPHARLAERIVSSRVSDPRSQETMLQRRRNLQEVVGSRLSAPDPFQGTQGLVASFSRFPG